jgi:hypothetical protein
VQICRFRVLFLVGLAFGEVFTVLGLAFWRYFGDLFRVSKSPLLASQFQVSKMRSHVCVALSRCLSLSSPLSSWSLSRALSRSPSPLLRPDFLPLLSEQCKGFCITVDWIQAGERKQRGFKIQA